MFYIIYIYTEIQRCINILKKRTKMRNAIVNFSLCLRGKMQNESLSFRSMKGEEAGEGERVGAISHHFNADTRHDSHTLDYRLTLNVLSIRTL